MHSQHTRWSRAEIDYLCDLLLQGIAVHEIAQRLRRSTGAVRTRMRQLRGRLRPK